MKFSRKTRILSVLVGGLTLMLGGIAQAQNPSGWYASGGQSTGPQDPRQDAIINAVKFDQKLNSQVPLDATFRDETGKNVSVKELLNNKPVVWVTVFYNCRTLCSEVLNETVRSLKDVNFTPGKEFDVVVLSINPRETPALAAEKKRDYLKMYGRAGTDAGWHFLTGEEKEIKRVTESIGFGYEYDPKSDQYAHPNGIVVVTPHGKVARYFYGLEYPPRSVKFGLMEASNDKIGSPVDQLLLTCFHYDPQSGEYNVLVMGIMRWAAGLTVLGMLLGIVIVTRGDKKTKAERDAIREKIAGAGV